MGKSISFIISIIFYLLGVGGLFLMIFWIGDLLPFISMHRPAEISPFLAILVNAGLILLFGVQHSVMARESFKKKWTSIIPRHLERSIYVLVSGLLCVIIVYSWAPINGSLWAATSGSTVYYLLYGLFFFGILFLLASTFLVNHFELFGLQQTFQNMRSTSTKAPVFKEHFFYKVIRHPIYLGFMLILWSTPHMTMTHLSLAIGFTLYIYVGIYYEEKDLLKVFGQTYANYRKRVPKLIPFLK